ncbi:MAG: exodeoxyribonuclease VII large subunit [Synechococcaceae cyanobacterium]|nr:exodeoxyribonuclease VII large subunit [Synechococcaceae cyanobacterium]
MNEGFPLDPVAWDPRAIPRYDVAELNEAIGRLLERGFAGRFLVDATVSRPQLRKGHLWLTLTDGTASIPAVIWASQLRRLSFLPEEGDGVVVVGRLNFWTTRASLSVQVLDLRPSLSAVLRQFERVRSLLAPEGLFDPERKRPLPEWPRRIALLTSAPSSALADMLRTARERWPSTALLVVPIPVQGAVESRIRDAVVHLGGRVEELEIDALVLARGGGSREDLTVFDGEELARALAACPVPVVCGLGHEDDTTIADLVADYRAATPTAAIVALLPDRGTALDGLRRRRSHLREVVALRLQAAAGQLERQRQRLLEFHPATLLRQRRTWLEQQARLLQALSPRHLLERGFSLVRDSRGRLVRSVAERTSGEVITVELLDGSLRARVLAVEAAPAVAVACEPQAQAPG